MENYRTILLPHLHYIWFDSILKSLLDFFFFTMFYQYFPAFDSQATYYSQALKIAFVNKCIICPCSSHWLELQLVCCHYHVTCSTVCQESSKSWRQLIRKTVWKISSSLDLETVIVRFDFGWLPDDHPAVLSLPSSSTGEKIRCQISRDKIKGKDIIYQSPSGAKLMAPVPGREHPMQ